MYFISVTFLIVTFSSIYSHAHHEERELRNEEFTSLGKKIHEGEVKVQPSDNLMLKVMTYNVLAQPQVDSNLYLYEHHDANALKWEFRWPLIYNKIKQEDPQILCLQEVEPSHMSSHFDRLKELGYDYMFEKNSGTHEDGVAVFYKSDLFEVEAMSCFNLNKGEDPLNIDKAGIVVRLQVRSAPQRRFVVATTHLVFNRHRGDTRLAEIMLVLAEMDELAFNRTSALYYPVILTGDFNLQPYTAVYRFLTEGHLKYEGLSRQSLEPSQDKIQLLTRRLLPCTLNITDSSQYVEEETKYSPSKQTEKPTQENNNCYNDPRFGSGTVSHGLNFRSAYPHKQGNKLEASTNHYNQWITVDYIFYSSVKEKEIDAHEQLELLSWERLPTQDEFDSHYHHIPNSDQGSDHLPLSATFLLRLN